MNRGLSRLLIHGVIATSLLCCLAACQKGGRSSAVICGENCASFQHTDLLPEQPVPGTIRLAIGGDSSPLSFTIWVGKPAFGHAPDCDFSLTGLLPHGRCSLAFQDPLV
jgi:hypothetical protein